MKTYIALFRGINLAGRHRVAMKDLRAMFESNGCCDVQTYIQSGNVIFRSATSDMARMTKQIGTAVAKRHGFEPRVLVLTPAEIERAAKANPYAEAVADPKTLHLFFLTELPRKPDLKGLEALRAGRERFQLKGRVFYLNTPDGFGTSKLAERAERLLGVEATARNWRTVTTLLAMVDASA